jgi:hypothetical protein
MLPVQLCRVFAEVVIRAFSQQLVEHEVEQLQAPTTGTSTPAETVADVPASGTGFDWWSLFE